MYFQSSMIWSQEHYQLNCLEATTRNLVAARFLSAWKDSNASEQSNAALFQQTSEGMGHTPGSPCHTESLGVTFSQRDCNKAETANAWWQHWALDLQLPSLPLGRAPSRTDFLWLFTLLLNHPSKVKTPQNSPFLSSQLLFGYLSQQFFGKEVLILHEKAHSRPWGLREGLHATTGETEIDFLFTSHPWSSFFNPSQRPIMEKQWNKRLFMKKLNQQFCFNHVLQYLQKIP